jgi:hypothetical protein
MHQDATHGMKTETAFLIPYASDPVSDPNLVWAFPPKRKLRRIVQHQDGALDRNEAILRCLEVPSQNVGFIHAFVREEAICCFGVRPILASHWNALADRIAYLF